MKRDKKNTFIIFAFLMIIFVISITVFVSNPAFKNIPSIDSTNAYWLYSSVMQLNGAMIGLFFVSLSIAISKKNSLVDYFGEITSLFLFINTGLLVIITIVCCLGLFYPKDIFMQKLILGLESTTLIYLFIIISSIAYKYIKMN